MISQNSQVIKIEAEDYLDFYDRTAENKGGAYRNDAVDIWQMKSKINKSSYRIGSIQSGEWLTYDLELPQSGKYEIVARVGTKQAQNRKFSVTLDEKLAANFNFGKTGERFWQEIVSEEIELSKGKHQLQLDMLSPGFALDYLELIPVSEAESTPQGARSVKIGGGGFVTGIITHPQAEDVVYARTDVGGLYRWDAKNEAWQQLLSKASVGQKVSLAVESVAIDPNNSKILYTATGAYTHKEPGHILKSEDGGNSWRVLNLSLPMGGNGEWRWTGERLAVDPYNSNVVYFGSRTKGLWRSQNGGESWQQIPTTAIPQGNNFGVNNNPAGVTFIEFDPASPGVVYVGVSGKGVYRSNNNGNSWQSLAGLSNSSIPQQGEVNGDGELVVTLFDPKGNDRGGIWKWSNSGWKEVTPKQGQNYAGLTVDASQPNNLFAVSYPMTPNDIYRSTDGGDSWQALNSHNQGLDWYPNWSFWTLSGDLAVDPQDSNQVWLSNGIGVWQTKSAWGDRSNWSVKVAGLEETVPFDGVSTPGGANLITAIADFDGFRHTDIAVTPGKNHSDGEFTTTTSIDYSGQNPNFLVRASSSHHDYSQYSGFSRDNGKTWQKFASIVRGNHPEDLSFGNIAVAARSVDNMVWQGSNWAAPYYTKDGGANWQRIDFFDRFGGGAHTHLWNRQQALAADTVEDNTFYIYHHTGGELIRTQDGGESWTVANQDSLLPAGVWNSANVKTAPGKAGDVWVGLDDFGLYHSSNAGKTFDRLEGVEDAEAIGFGKAAPGKDEPTLFLSGQIRGELGVFGSTDLGQSWSKVNDLPDEFLGQVQTVIGDANNFGRVYLGIASTGFVYGDL